jgi:signal peptidase I
MNQLKKFWKFIWYDDSILAWVLNLIVAFLVVKFIIYPLLGLLLGTGFPVVAVVSGSMEHAYTPKLDSSGEYTLSPDGEKLIYIYCSDFYYKEKSTLNFRDFRDIDDFWKNCGGWYEENNITQTQFESFSFSNGFNKGDIIVITGRSVIEVGDVIVFQGRSSNPIIHRVVEINKVNNNPLYTTKGDHNVNTSPLLGEINIPEDRVIGKAVFKIPWLGWVKIWFSDALGVFF